MLSRPTTQQILLDCRHELLTTIDAALTDPAAKVAIQMLENVLRNCAERAAHEIAWMHEETDAMISFAEALAATAATDDRVAASLAAYRDHRQPSLHLDDVVVTYSLASECLSAALEAAVAAGDSPRETTGRALLRQRLAHEQQIMGEWTFVGRG